MINLNLSFGSVAEMRSTLTALLAGESAPAPTVEAAPAPKPAKAAKPAPTPTAQPTTTATEAAPAQTEPAAEPAVKAITLEEVRAKLAALSQGGKTAEVKAIISAIGCAKLTDIPADKYAEVLEKAAAL